jgi:hypothetical protein
MTRSRKIVFDLDRRQNLPYGKWTCADGREVLFNRGYKPIWERCPGGAARPADRSEWIPWLKQEWFYDDSTKDPRQPAEAALNTFRAGLPTAGIPTGCGTHGARTRSDADWLFG